MPGVCRCDLTTRVLSTTTSAHAAIGRIGRPAFPAPSDWRGRHFPANLGRNAPRDREVVSPFVIARSTLVRRSPPSGEGGCDEAIHSFFMPRDGLLRFARKDG